MPNSDQPFSWPKNSGTLTASVMRDYASHLFPRLDLEWEAPGVEKRPSHTSGEPKARPKPFMFRKSKGWMNIQKDLRPFATYIMQKLIKWANRKPYMPSRKAGPAMISDLQELDAHVNVLLKMKKAEQSRTKSAS